MLKEKKVIEETKKIRNSFKYAGEGIISAFKSERNMKFHVLALVIVLLLGWTLKITIAEWIICIILFGMVISAEIFNTALEVLVDMVMPKINDKAKLAKDLAAGAVLVTALSSAIVGAIIFIPKIINLF